MKKKIKNFFIKIARRILRQELQDLNNEIQTLKEQAQRDKYCRTDILMSKSVMRDLIRILPNVNSPKEELFDNLKRITSELLSLVEVKVINEAFGVLRLTLRIKSCDCIFHVYRRQKTITYNMFGFATELTTGYWSVDGVKVVSNEDFDLIFNAVNSQRNALQELSEEDCL